MSLIKDQDEAPDIEPQEGILIGHSRCEPCEHYKRGH